MAKHLVVSPGYHIRPKYDMAGFRNKMEKGGERDYDMVLPLTSMIDMFSMLVIFLLLNFSATGEAYFVAKDIKLPEAENARPLESLPLITVTKQYVSIDSEQIGTNPADFSMNNWNMEAFSASLRRLKALQDNLRAAGLKPKTEVNIQADKGTPVLYVKRVMNVLITEGFTGINFAVKEGSDEEGGG
ncbi:MAG: biopolymer transporter ExbD [Bdellovibrionales bacterium]|nr:biopolymer transporter ExbD [Bdellovibrionales bacterium]